MKNKPDIRFDGFNYAWEQRRLGKYTSLITKGTTPKDKSGKGDVNFVKVENIINGNIFPLTKISDDEHENYLRRSRLEENDILFSIAGTLGRTATVDKDILPANTNQALAIIRGYKFDKNFLVTSLNGEVVNDYIRKNPTVGAQPNLSLEQVGNLVISTPKESEQAKIGYFFQTLDNLITLHQRELENYKLLKKGFLQKLFPSNGDTNPSIRFDGFTDAWEQRKLVEVADYRNGKAHEQDIDEDGDYIVVNSKFVSTNGKVKKFSNALIEPLEAEEIAFVLSDVPNGKAIARTFLVEDNNKYSLNQRIAGITPHNDTDPYFLSVLMDRNYYFLKFDNGVGQTNLTKSDVEEFPERYPNYEEQTKIGDLFKQLDNTITLHQRELENYKELKKGFLQKMFV